MEFSDVA